MPSGNLEIKHPEDRLFLTVDTYQFVNLLHIRQDIGNLVHAVKLGIRFIRATQAPIIRRHLAAHKVSMFLDAKLGQTANLMGGDIQNYELDDYRYLSVSAAVAPKALAAASLAARKSKIVVAIPPKCPKMVDLYLDTIEEANDQLGDKKLTRIMCDVADLERVRLRNGFILTATGICLPNYTGLDAEERMTPAQALDAGADYLAIGSAVLAASNRTQAMDIVLENMATAL